MSLSGERLPAHARFVAMPAGRDHDIDLSVVVPAFEEEQRLPSVLASLRDRVDADRTEVIVVDDGSRDATVAVAKAHGEWCPRLRVIEHGSNRGKGAAVRTGVMAASGELVGFVDADDATDLAALAPMCDAIDGPVGAVFGSRHAPGSVVVGSPPIRGVMGRVFNHLVKYAAGTTISDTQCGAKVFRTPVARAVFGGSTVDGFAFDVEILRRLSALDIDVVEHPVSWRYVSGTKIRPLTPLRMLIDIAKLRMQPMSVDVEAIRCRYEPAIEQVALPLRPGVDIAVGDPCEVIIPGSGDARIRLEALGVIDS